MHTTEQQDIVWIQFNDPTIAKFRRQRMQSLYKSCILPSWTPIMRIARRVKTGTKIVTQTQFPFQLACAQTIHRAQGLTMGALAFDPSKVYQHGLVYTALSRVRNIESLYLMHQLQHSNFKVCQKVDNEMQRLRTSAQWKLQYNLSSVPSN